MMTLPSYRRLVARLPFLFALLVLLLIDAKPAHAQATNCASQGVSSSTTGAVTWTPQWCQEFNATSAGPPDTTAWSFDLGGGGWGNNEVEIYCGPPGTMNNPSQCPTMFSTTTNTVYLDGSGHLVIQPINNGTWISTRMKTQGKTNFQYGRIEASIQLPDTTNQGLWPAFWSLGSNITTVGWPACGEADIMEVWSPVLNGPGPNGNRATIHTAMTGGPGNGRSFTFPTGQTNNSAFHTYGVIWSANMMQYYVGTPGTAPNPFFVVTPSDLASNDTWPFNASIFLLTNVAIGGNLGGSTQNLVNPQPMTFDYIRQYTASTVPSPSLGSPPSIMVKAGATTGNSSTFTPTPTANTGFVYFSCGTNAPKSSCAISTNDLLNTHVVNSSPAGAAETVTVTVATTANTISFPFLSDPRIRLRLPIAILAVLLLALAAFLLLRGKQARRPAFALAGFALVLALIAGCGGGGSYSAPPPPSGGTTPGSYAVTVYAFTESNTSDGTNAHADASVQIPLTVN